MLASFYFMAIWILKMSLWHSVPWRPFARLNFGPECRLCKFIPLLNWLQAPKSWVNKQNLSNDKASFSLTPGGNSAKPYNKVLWGHILVGIRPFTQILWGLSDLWGRFSLQGNWYWFIQNQTIFLLPSMSLKCISMSYINWLWKWLFS